MYAPPPHFLLHPLFSSGEKYNIQSSKSKQPPHIDVKSRDSTYRTFAALPRGDNRDTIFRYNNNGWCSSVAFNVVSLRKILFSIHGYVWFVSNHQIIENLQ